MGMYVEEYRGKLNHNYILLTTYNNKSSKKHIALMQKFCMLKQKLLILISGLYYFRMDQLNDLGHCRASTAPFLNGLIGSKCPKDWSLKC